MKRLFFLLGILPAAWGLAGAAAARASSFPVLDVVEGTIDLSGSQEFVPPSTYTGSGSYEARCSFRIQEIGPARVEPWVTGSTSSPSCSVSGEGATEFVTFLGTVIRWEGRATASAQPGQVTFSFNPTSGEYRFWGHIPYRGESTRYVNGVPDQQQTAEEKWTFVLAGTARVEHGGRVVFEAEQEDSGVWEEDRPYRKATYTYRSALGATGTPPHCPTLVEALVKRVDESEKVFDGAFQRFGVGDAIAGRLRADPDLPSGPPIKWELSSQQGTDPAVVRDQGAGSELTYTLPQDGQGQWRLRFYCDQNENDLPDGTEPAVETRFEVLEPRVVELTVARHLAVPFTEDAARQLLDEGTELLRRRDRLDDERSIVQLRLGGTLLTFGQRRGKHWVPAPDATTKKRLRALLDPRRYPADVKIVRAIRMPGEELNGAALLGRPGFVVAAGVQAATWVHEWGHTLGIRHSEPPRDHRIMYGVGVPDRNTASLPEALTYMGASAAFGARAAPPIPPGHLVLCP